MLTIHHLGLSQSERIVWLCEELGVPYDLVRYERDALSRMAPPNYKSLSSFGTAPVITDGDLVLGESGAIMEYIIHRHGGGRLALAPSDPNYADYLFWFHFANASMMPAAMTGMVAAMLVGDGTPDRLQPLLHRTELAHQMVEDRLGKAPYFAGPQFTAADIMMAFAFTTMRQFAPRDLSNCPNTRAYLKRIGERPAYVQAMKKAEPDRPLMLD